MNGNLHIQYLTRAQVNETKWDACIQAAPNGLIYSYSFYLDRMATNWHALVLNDYEAVMPLTWNRKYGISYLYQPFLAAQTGITGREITQGTVSHFLHAVPRIFKYWDIYLNHGNVFPAEGFDIYTRSNYVLNLQPGYDELYRSYRDNIRRNVRKALQMGCTLQKGFDVNLVINLAVQQMQRPVRGVVDNIERFRRLYHFLHQREMATTYGIFSDRGELLASCVFFFSHGRAYYILVGNHPNGKTIGASHALIDAFIQDNAGTSQLLDFEGSDIRNLAFFYSSFGAVEEKFAGVRLNRLPFYMKWLKK